MSNQDCGSVVTGNPLATAVRRSLRWTLGLLPGLLGRRRADSVAAWSTRSAGRHAGQSTRVTRRRRGTMYGEPISFWDSGPLVGTPEPDAIVLVHGIAGSAQSWSALLAELARRGDRHRIIVPDLVGHGSSSAPWADYSLGGYATGIRDLLVALGHRSASIIGHSLGGGIAAQFAYQYPEHCDRLVLVDSGGLGRDVHPCLRAATLPGAEWVLPLITHPKLATLGERLARATYQIHPWGSASSWQAARSYASLAVPDHRTAFLHTARSVLDPGGQRVQATNRLDLAAGLPTMIAWGTADTMIPIDHAHRAHARMRETQLALFEGAGHFPHCDQPSLFADRILRFLATTRPAHLNSTVIADRITANTVLAEY